MDNNQFVKTAGTIAFFLLCIATPVIAQIKTRPPVQVAPVTEVPVELNECLNLKTTIQRHSISETPCCYKITLDNTLASNSKLAPWGFQVELKYGHITQVYGTQNTWKQTPLTVPPLTGKVQWQNNKLIPAGSLNLASVCIETDKPTWLYYAWLDRTGKILCRDSMLINDCLYEYESACKNPLIRNGEFTPATAANQPPTFWGVGYGAPKFLNTSGEGCFDPGYVELSGNQTTGDAIVQLLAPTNQLLKGKKYLLQVAVKFKQTHGGPDYCRLRAVAWNTTIGFAGTHPGPGSNVAIIGRSGKIRACSDWSIVEFPVWVANNDFHNIGISAFTNDNTVSNIWIDNVSLCETTGDDCNEISLDAKGNPIPPEGYGGPLPLGFTCVPEPEDDEFDNGSLSDLYSGLYGYDGTTNWYAQATDKCFSIGGTLPAEVLQYNCDDSLKAMGIQLTCTQLEQMLANPNLDTLSTVKPSYLPPIKPLTPCKKTPPLNDAGNWAFKGRDIIYIHGLELGHLGDRMLGNAGAMANWPNQPGEFYGQGYYKKAANDTWKDHIDYFADNKNYINRYLVVSYSCSQRLDVAVHSVLSQIRDAMANSKDVKVNRNDPRGKNCFGKEYIIISQSTGAIIGDVLLAIAEKTKTDPVLAAKYGNIGYIADRCKGHIARRGAFSGSDLATILVALASDVPNTGPVAATYLNNQSTPFNFNPANLNDLFIVRNSILIDLMPSVARSKWGPYLDEVPVPVLTVAGGHPTFFEKQWQAPLVPLKYTIHPGFDDGVITTDCSNGRKNTLQPVSTFKASSKIKVFDMGSTPGRAISYYLDQRHDPGNNIFTASATPYLSPAGMVQPVVGGSVLMNPYYKNHYSFIQAAAEHWIKKNGNFCCSYNYTAYDGMGNKEEQLVVNNAALYSSGVIDPAIKGEMRETIKGRYILYPAGIKVKKVNGLWRPVVIWKEYWIWKRTYHNLRNGSLYDFDYVYPYLFKN